MQRDAWFEEEDLYGLESDSESSDEHSDDDDTDNAGPPGGGLGDAGDGAGSSGGAADGTNPPSEGGDVGGGGGPPQDTADAGGSPPSAADTLHGGNRGGAAGPRGRDADGIQDALVGEPPRGRAAPLSSIAEAVAAAEALVGLTTGKAGDADADGEGGRAATADVGGAPEAGGGLAEAVEAAAEPMRELELEDAQQGGGHGPLGRRQSGRVQDAPGRLSQYGAAIAAHVASNPDKMPIQRARKEADWPQFDAAGQAEVSSLWRNGTWVLADLPRGAKLLPTQMLCERKRGADGEVSRYKGRFVACGNHQVAGRDYTEVWAPVARHATLRALLSTAAVERMMLYQLDVETAFLNGEVDKELYLQQPRGYERGGAGKVCRLVQAIYGLKQAARAWYLKQVKLRTEMGMEQCTSDPCLFSRPGVDGSTKFVLVYVDDILLMCKTQAGIDAMKQSVTMAFSSRDIGPPSYFLGLHIGRDEEKGLLTVSRRRYVLSLV